MVESSPTMGCLALHGHEGLKCTKDVKGERIGNKGESGKKNGSSKSNQVLVM